MINDLSLKQICSIYSTDKNNYHCYVDEVYEDLFKYIRYSTKKFLEIGIDNGASAMMWREYFANAGIMAIDNKVCPQVLDRERIQSFVADAYTYSALEQLPNDFDIIIDDGSHTLEDMSFVVVEYIKKINKSGLLILEDIQDFNWTNILKSLVPSSFKVEVRDLRKIRGRYDDIIMVIKASDI